MPTNQTVVFDVRINSSQFDNSMKGMMMEMKSLKGQLGNNLLDKTTQQQILVRMGELKGKIADMKMAITSIDKGDHFGNLAKMMSPLVTGMMALTTASGLFTDNNEKLAKIQQKINGLVSIFMILQQLADKQNQKGLYAYYAGKVKELWLRAAEYTATKAQIVSTNLETAAKTRSGIASKAAAAAQWLWNAAMNANPIMLIITAIAALTAGTIALVRWMRTNKEEVKQISEAEKERLATLNKISKSIEEHNKQRDILLGKTTEEIEKRKELTKAYQDALRQYIMTKAFMGDMANTDWGKKSIEVLIAKMKEAAAELAAFEAGVIKGNEDKSTAYEKLNNEIGKLEAKLKNQVLLGDKNAQNTADELKKKKELLSEVEKQMKFLLLEKNLREEILDIQKSAIKIPPIKTGLVDMSKTENEKIKEDSKKTAANAGLAAGGAYQEAFTSTFGKDEGVEYTNMEAWLGGFFGEDDLDKIKANLKELKDTIGDTFGVILTDQLAYSFQKQIDQMNSAIEDQHETQLENLEERKNQGLITENQYNSEKESIEAEYEAKKKEGRIKEAQIRKEEALWDIAIGTAVAIVSNLKSGFWTIALTAALGAAQAAAVAAKPIPKYAKGGILGQGTYFSAGEEGPEAIMNASATSALKPLLSDINSAFGGVKFSDKNSGMVIMSKDQFKGLLNSMENRPVKAYVLESDITTTQKRVSRIKESASF